MMSQQKRNEERSASLLDAVKSKSDTNKQVISNEYKSPFADLTNKSTPGAPVKSATTGFISPDMKPRRLFDNNESEHSLGTSGLFASPKKDPFAVLSTPVSPSVFSNGTNDKHEFKGVSPSVAQNNSVFGSEHRSDPNLQSKIDELRKLSETNRSIGSPFESTITNHQLQMTPEQKTHVRENLITKARSGSPSRNPIVKSGSPKQLSVKEKIEQIRNEQRESVDSKKTPTVADKIAEIKERSQKSLDKECEIKQLSVADKIAEIKSSSNKNSQSLQAKIDHIRSQSNRSSSPNRPVLETMKHLKENIVEKAEHVLAPQLALLAKHGFIVDKIFHDRDAGCVYLNTHNKVGTNFVIEVVHKSAEGLYLSDGHILSRHTGEEFNLSKQMIEHECKLSGECGIFAQQGDKVVVSKKDTEQLHKASYIVSTIDSEKSLLENNNIISVPVIRLEQLEGSEESVAQLMILVNMRYQEYFFKAADDSDTILSGALNDLRQAESTYATFLEQYRIAIKNSIFKLQIVDRNLIFYKMNGDQENFNLSSIARRELFEDTLKMISTSREISTIIEHAANTKRACEQKLEELISLGVKYM